MGHLDGREVRRAHRDDLEVQSGDPELGGGLGERIRVEGRAVAHLRGGA